MSNPAYPRNFNELNYFETQACVEKAEKDELILRYNKIIAELTVKNEILQKELDDLKLKHRVAKKSKVLVKDMQLD